MENLTKKHLVGIALAAFGGILLLGRGARARGEMNARLSKLESRVDMAWDELLAVRDGSQKRGA